MGKSVEVPAQRLGRPPSRAVRLDRRTGFIEAADLLAEEADVSKIDVRVDDGRSTDPGGRSTFRPTSGALRSVLAVGWVRSTVRLGSRPRGSCSGHERL
jgi:hypothetical protein